MWLGVLSLSLSLSLKTSRKGRFLMGRGGGRSPPGVSFSCGRYYIRFVYTMARSRSSQKRSISQRRRRAEKSCRIHGRRVRNRRTRGGGCGCGGQSGASTVSVPPNMASSLFKGGEPSPGFNQVPKDALYPLNSYNNDPNYGVVASRQTNAFMGGKRARGRNTRGRTRGGGLMSTTVTGLQNAVLSTNIAASPYASTSQFFQAPYTKYGPENTPLV